MNMDRTSRRLQDVLVEVVLQAASYISDRLPSVMRL